jgi:hypothetical protein
MEAAKAQNLKVKVEKHDVTRNILSLLNKYCTAMDFYLSVNCLIFRKVSRKLERKMRPACLVRLKPLMYNEAYRTSQEMW